jgi:hypothetical protein
MTPTVSAMKPATSQLDQVLAQLESLKAENEALKAKAIAKSVISFKVSEKGAVSVYGLGRFPVTLYGEQWERLLAKAADLKAFMTANKSRLSTK